MLFFKTPATQSSSITYCYKNYAKILFSIINHIINKQVVPSIIVLIIFIELEGIWLGEVFISHISLLKEALIWGGGVHLDEGVYAKNVPCTV